MVSVGCIMGIGFGLMYCPAIVIVTMYFEKKRSHSNYLFASGFNFLHPSLSTLHSYTNRVAPFFQAFVSRFYKSLVVE